MCNELKVGNVMPFAEWLARGWALPPVASLVLASYLQTSMNPPQKNKDGTIGMFRFNKGRGPKKKIGIAMRDMEIFERVSSLMAGGKGLYESAIATAAKEFGVSPQTARDAYDEGKRAQTEAEKILGTQFKK